MEVVIVQRRLNHYRVPLFEQLRESLRSDGIGLRLLVGRGTPEEDAKYDSGELKWTNDLPTHYFFGGRLCWQPFEQHLAGADLVIVTQENKLLYNHLLVVRPRRFRLAFWGHGANLQGDSARGIRERFKRWTTNRVDWWFAYTQLSADLVAAAGFPRSRITVLNNAVDTSELLRLARQVREEDIRELRNSLSFDDAPVGVFMGSFYAEKRLDFLFESAQGIRREIGNFRLLLIGDGPQRSMVQAWCEANPWVRWVGTKRGQEKVRHLATAQVMLNPGGVGLVVVDSFGIGLPMVVARGDGHGPEIVYVRNGFNGVLTGNDSGEYAHAVVDLLRHRGKLARLQAGCLACAEEYTMQNMVRRFTAGIGCALGRSEIEQKRAGT